MEIDNLLKDHCLVKKPIVKNKLSLFLALSEALYFTSVYKHHIQDILKEELKNRQASHSLPLSLNAFSHNQALIMDYMQNQISQNYLKTNLELTSLAFQVKIELFQVNSQNQLQSLIINHRYVNKIQIFQSNSQHFEPLFYEEFLQNSLLCQQILYSLLNKTFDAKFHIPKTIKFIEFENWMAEQDKDKVSNVKVRKGSHSNLEQIPEKKIMNLVKDNKKERDDNPLVYFKNDPPGLTPTTSQKIIPFGTKIESQPSLKDLQNASATPQKKHILIEESQVRYTGKLKFFDEKKNFGFILLDENPNSEIFLHYDDLQKSGISVEQVVANKQKIQFSFYLQDYIGKYSRSRKAIDLKIIQ